MRVAIRVDDEALDVDLAESESAASLADLLRAASCPDPPDVVFVDGQRHRSSDPLAAVNLFEGSEIAGDRADRTGVLVELVRLVGVGAGLHLGLDAGVYDVGGSAKAEPHLTRPDEPHFRITVHPDGRTTIAALAPGVIVEGATRSSQVVTTPDAVYRVEVVDHAGSKWSNRHGRRHAGRLVATRSPRLFAAFQQRPVDTPLPPEPAREALPISWLVALAPVPIGVILAIVFSPFFLAFAAMSPAISLARWRDGKKRERVDRTKHARQTADRLHLFASEIRARADAEANHRRDRYCDVRRQYRAVAEANSHLWEVRPEHPDFLEVTVGLGERPWRPDINHRSDMEGADDVIDACGFLVSAPVTVRLPEVRALGVVGDAGFARRLASAIVLETVVRHGPADIELNCLFDDASTERWAWVKWLSHLYADTGEARLATNDNQARVLLDRPEQNRYSSARDRPSAEPTTLLVIDGPSHLESGAVAASTIVNRHDAVAIVVAERAQDLPAFCGAVAHVDPAGKVRLTTVATGEVVSEIIAPIVNDATLSRTARRLARYADADSTRAAIQLPDRCRLGEVLAMPLTAANVVSGWHRPPAGLRAALGSSLEGRFEIDLVRDGPHALIAGTTGAGKSELLRTLVASLAWTYSPDQVTFVLVDFKGGGAFDACADLPHTVGVVTDLDASLAARALRCLSAELQHRERRLRASGVSDIADLPEHDDSLPRLVIVVDEFATLAKELPNFMDALIDVAQRGRSLGIHLVLATQRPAGVVDAKIRANTNLRIALRVQDETDALEVINSTVAAEIHRTRQGRAFARLGAGELISFQTAMVSEPPAAMTATGLSLTPFTLGRPDPSTTTVEDDTEPAPGGPTELETITDVAQRAVAELGLAAPRVPWPAPLPDQVDFDDLNPEIEAPWEIAVGLVDLPDEQRQDVFGWSATADGNVLVYGVDPAASARVLGTYCSAIAATHDPAAAHLYIVDYAGALSALADLPHVGGYLGPEDDERIERLLDLLDAELEGRRRSQREKRAATLGPEDVPLLGVFIANYSGLLEHFDEVGDLDAHVRLAGVVRDGPALGIFVFASGVGERGIPMKVASQVPTKYIMRMADPAAYTTFGLRAADVPNLGPGRAIDAQSRLEVQFASTEYTVSSEPWPSIPGGPVRLRTLETSIGFEQVSAASEVADDCWRLAVGIGHDRLDPTCLELRPGVHAVVAGPPASGRSSALRTIAAAANVADPAIAIGSIGLDGVGRLVQSADQLEAFAASPGLLLVDDLEVLPTEVAAVLERIVARPPAGLRLVVAGRTDTMRAMSTTTRLLTAGRTGILLQPQPDAGDVFRVRLRFKGPFPVGRGVLLNSGTGEVVQLALSPDLVVDRPQPRLRA